MSESMVHIKSVHVEGYKSIVNADVAFKPGLNIMIGKNGAGKSNLLNAIGGLILEKRNILGTAKAEAILQSGSAKTARFGSSYLNGNVEVQIDRQILNFVNSNGAAPSATLAISSQSNESKDALLTLIPHATPLAIPFLDRRLDITIQRMSMEVDHLWNILVDESIPYFARSMAAKLFWIVRSEHADFEHGNNELDALKFWAWEIAELVRPSLMDLTPIQDVRLSESVTMRGTNTSHAASLLNIAFEFKLGEEWLEFEKLSDGTKRMVFIAFSVAGPIDFFPTLSGINHLVFGSRLHAIILLEEPELGIHPHQLHLLLLFLKEQAKTQQIIITTHSPQVLDILDKDELDRIIVADYHPAQGSTFSHLTEEKKVKALAYMQDMLLSDFWRFSNLEERATR